MFWLHLISSQESGVPNLECDLQKRSLLLKFVFDRRGKGAAWWNSWVLEFGLAHLRSCSPSLKHEKVMWEGSSSAYLRPSKWDSSLRNIMTTQLEWITWNNLELWEGHCIHKNHRIMEWPGLKTTIVIMQFQPPCYVRGHQPLRFFAIYFLVSAVVKEVHPRCICLFNTMCGTASHRLMPCTI